MLCLQAAELTPRREIHRESATLSVRRPDRVTHRDDGAAPGPACTCVDGPVQRIPALEAHGAVGGGDAPRSLKEAAGTYSHRVFLGPGGPAGWPAGPK